MYIYYVLRMVKAIGLRSGLLKFLIGFQMYKNNTLYPDLTITQKQLA